MDNFKIERSVRFVLQKPPEALHYGQTPTVWCPRWLRSPLNIDPAKDAVCDKRDGSCGSQDDR